METWILNRVYSDQTTSKKQDLEGDLIMVYTIAPYVCKFA